MTKGTRPALFVLKFLDYAEEMQSRHQEFSEKYHVTPARLVSVDVYADLLSNIFITLIDEALHWTKKTNVDTAIHVLLDDVLNIGKLIEFDKEIERQDISLKKKQKLYKYPKFEQMVLYPILEEFIHLQSYLLKDRKWHRFDFNRHRRNRLTHTLFIKDLGDHRILWYHEHQAKDNCEILDDAECQNLSEGEAFDLVNAYLTEINKP